ncbi:DNA methyltransferase [Maritimibacter fusiformis]|uniref:site-specific DNA-methyltransferase (adenine-specific) n=1 Tax=Maritimibacter fusiformis TaxID=2603819 RepID=A0A5D0R4T3_9RHOB|nr:DNA methyltransferase [Maritimibacter fusiformis]TYB76527.1 site-specific DNA-methyltransferase [Maritimibacter fusiformis]
MTEQLKMDGGKNGGPVECLGMTFPNDDARREHFLKLLAEKLNEPEFRSIAGFPDADDASILELSDPPYYTACPNPFVEQFIQTVGRPHSTDEDYSSLPFIADVKEGKNDPIYNAHSYHTKVPHKAVMRYLLHYTKPGDLILDAFCGTGMTGVAAQLCGDRSVLQSMGYQVLDDGTVLEQQDEDGQKKWRPVSQLGARNAILCDLSPAATFIASNYNKPLDRNEFTRASNKLLAKVNNELGWMYETSHGDNGPKGKINYVVWSDVFLCPECSEEMVFWDVAVDREIGKIHDKFNCPHCSSELDKRSVERAWLSSLDPHTDEPIRQPKQAPVLINYSVGTRRFEKVPDANDFENFRKIEEYELSYWVPVDEVQDGDKTGEPKRLGITRAHHFYSKSSLAWLAALRSHAGRLDHRFLVTYSMLNTLSKMYRYVVKKPDYKGQGGGILSGTLYIPSLNRGLSVTSSFKRGASRLSAIFDERRPRSSIITTESAGALRAPDNSVDYIFIDPPFGANIMYSELNFLWEAWLKVRTSPEEEAIENRSQGKNLDAYRSLMIKCFREAFRVLKPGRWMTVEFSNTKASVWNAIQSALQEAGFVVANVAALDKKQGSFNAINNKTSVKQDLVISAYKPSEDLERKFDAGENGEKTAWDFVESHLRHLPVFKAQNGLMEFVTERDPRILFDRMVAWFVRHNETIPLSSQEFQEGVRQRFYERDGMFFLADQVAEYDRKRSKYEQPPQIEMFVSDERSAIDWISDFLRKRPSTYQEIHPEFMAQLGAGWKKHEEKPELSALLEDNFLRFDGNGDVPSQIHSYLSTNFKDLRGLEKEDPRLKAKAKDRWYVPDPNKAKDLEQKRERSLLKEFEAYKTANKRQLKESRLEVLRAGFKTAWAAKDYNTIIGIAEKLPDETLQEDEKLLLWYDQALTRTEADA